MTAKSTAKRSKSAALHLGSPNAAPSRLRLGKERWVVERTISWLHANRRLDRRYDRRADIHEAFLTIGCALICHKHPQYPWR
jgi:transposase